MAYQPELEKLERRYQEDPARNFAQLAERYRKDGRLDEALDLLRRHLDERPNYVSGLIVLGRCHLDQQNDAEARETFERVLAVDAEHIIALRALGEIAERAGDVATARHWFTRLLDIDPMNEEGEQALERLATAEAGAPIGGPTPEVRTGDVAGSAMTEEAAEAEAEEGTGIVIERASAEPPVQAAELEPMELERSREPELAPEAAAEATPTFEIETAPTLDLEPLDEAGERDFEAGAEYDETPTPPFAEPAESAEAAGAVESPEPGEVAAVEGLFGRGEDAIVDEEVAAAASDLPGFEPFDESLGWDAGERMSQQLSEEDLAEAEAAREEGLEAAVQELPGLQGADVPGASEVAEVLDTPPVEGLQRLEAEDREVAPVEGFETHEVGVTPEPPRAEPVAADAPTDEADEEPSERAQDDEPAIHASAAGPTSAPPAVDRRASLAGLPVFLPDEGSDEPLVLDAEPEPVVTETMAELYVRQGLEGEARDVYRRLLAARPGDARLQARLAELERPGARRAQPKVERFAASATGGQRVRDYLADVLAGRPTPNADGKAATDVAEAEPQAPGPMDAAFNETAGGEGRPTQPASDEVSLSTIFGDAPTSGPSSGAPGRAPTSDRDPGGFSFDEFYGSSRGTSASRGPRDALADDEGDEAFRDWLKSLKS